MKIPSKELREHHVQEKFEETYGEFIKQPKMAEALEGDSPETKRKHALKKYKSLHGYVGKRKNVVEITAFTRTFSNELFPLLQHRGGAGETGVSSRPSTGELR